MFYNEKIVGVIGSNSVLLLMPGVTFPLSLLSHFYIGKLLDMSNGVPCPAGFLSSRNPARRIVTAQIVVSSCIAGERPGLFYKGTWSMHDT